ncbi:MAG: DUF4956 domain-containing protein [Deltaproteobacteria bacterium]|nr:DUF4956 domain-containing protein [Deltaproteobacteria bacterium]
MDGFLTAMATETLGAVPLRQVALSMLCAYLMGQGLSVLYAWMRRGQDYSRSFTQSLVLGGIVGAMIMLAIGNSLARGVGIFGALSLIRFRTNLRDPLDMIFIFAAFAAGIAAGAGNIAAGLVGSTIFALVILATNVAGGARGRVEAELRLRLAGDGVEPEQAVLAVLREKAAGFALLKRRVVAPGKEKAEQRLAYRVVLGEAADEEPLVRALQAVPSVVEATLGFEGSTATVPGGDDD